MAAKPTACFGGSLLFGIPYQGWCAECGYLEFFLRHIPKDFAPPLFGASKKRPVDFFMDSGRSVDGMPKLALYSIRSSVPIVAIVENECRMARE